MKTTCHEESCSTARLTWPSMDRRRTNQLLELDCNDISIAMASGYAYRSLHYGKARGKDTDFHLTTSVVDADLLKQKRVAISCEVHINVDCA